MRWRRRPACSARWTSCQASFPPGCSYDIVYNPTEFIAAVGGRGLPDDVRGGRSWSSSSSSCSCRRWRAALDPDRRHPGLADRHLRRAWPALGFSLNNLSLFGLVLAIGIVVDDAIVVVENVERNIRRGPVAARRRARDHGRGRRGADRHRAGAVARCSSRRLHHRHHRRSSSASSRVTIAASTIISCLRLADLEPGALRAAAEAA